MTDIDTLIATLSTPDNDREWSTELEAAFDAYGVRPDDNTKLASRALYHSTCTLIEAAVTSEVVSVNDANEEPVIDEHGNLSEGLSRAISGGAFIAALARDEEKDSPFVMIALIVRSLIDDDDKSIRNNLAKKALDNVRKGINVVSNHPPEDNA